MPAPHALEQVDGDERLELVEAWLAPDEADPLLARLLAGVPWEQRSIKLFGRDAIEPRLTAWYGDTGAVYTYSGRRNEPLAWRPELQALRARLEAELGTRFNSVLLNLYRDGGDSMGLHADDEPELGPEPTIASISLGATRRFSLRHRIAKRRRLELELTHGALLVMGGRLQARWRHGLAKEPSVDKPRINLTFRRIRA